MTENQASITSIEFKKHHIRARKARLARWSLKDQNQMLLKLVAIVLIALGLAGFMAGFELSGLAISPGIAIALFLVWVNGELRDMPAVFPEQKPQVLKPHLVLDKRVLGRLDKAETPKEIWQAIQGMWRERFFTVRYGMAAEFFEYGLSDDPKIGLVVWDRAYELARREGQQSITGASLLVSLMSTIHGYDKYLASLHIEPRDLIVGIDWQRHVELLIERVKHRSSFGGLARDWAAGYTPLLNQIGHNISLEVQNSGFVSRHIEAQVAVVNQMLATLSGSARQNVVLVGDPGVGKTTLIYELTQRLLLDPEAPGNLRYHQVIALSAPSLIAQVTDQRRLEAIIIGLLNEAQAAKNVILFFDHAELFFEQGTGKVDLSSVLMPVIENSSVRIVMAMNSNDWQTLSSRNSALVSLMNYQAAPEPDQENTMRIVEDQVLFMEVKHKVTFTYQSLLEAVRLADKYVHDLAFPGKAIRVLEGAVAHAQDGLVTEESIQNSMEASLGVKVKTATADEKTVLLNLEDSIHQRMVNQKRAVKVVSDALRRARSGVGNPEKPIGTFLFLGPTGVGKTELAKAVSSTYFGGDDQIVRVDMNEYVRSEDAVRLLTPAVEHGTSLIAQIRKQPFSVVLFDEVEKAHPDVVNLFLQLLDEGTLRDTNNKEVSFRDAIIIATSNAGADIIRKHIEDGEELEQFEQEFLDELVNSNQFKPEFLNRFDEMVIFRPLKPAELMRVVDLLINGVNKTLARQKISVSLDEGAKRWLVENGYDARLGARPLRRMVQRSVENIVAKKLLQSDFEPGSTLELTGDDLRESQED